MLRSAWVRWRGPALCLRLRRRFDGWTTCVVETVLTGLVHAGAVYLGGAPYCYMQVEFALRAEARRGIRQLVDSVEGAWTTQSVSRPS
jgi:hypothetical protein